MVSAIKEVEWQWCIPTWAYCLADVQFAIGPYWQVTQRVPHFTLDKAPRLGNNLHALQRPLTSERYLQALVVFPEAAHEQAPQEGSPESSGGGWSCFMARLCLGNEPEPVHSKNRYFLIC